MIVTSSSPRPPARAVPGAGGRSTPAAEPPRWLDPRTRAAISALAARWSLDDLDRRDDLYQEGCLAAWITSRREPGCPPAHLVRSAQERMIHCRHLGRSVDGRAHAGHERPHVYRILRLDQPADQDGRTPASAWEYLPSRVRDVEEQVLGYLHAAAFLASVGLLDRRILGLRLAGYRWSEISRTIRLQPRALHARRAALRAGARRHWNDEQPDEVR